MMKKKVNATKCQPPTARRQSQEQGGHMLTKSVTKNLCVKATRVVRKTKVVGADLRVSFQMCGKKKTVVEIRPWT